MLNHNLKHHLLPSALLVTGFLTLTGCTNNGSPDKPGGIKHIAL